MTEHEKLKEICDTIGYLPEDYWFKIEIKKLWVPDILKTSNWYQWTWNWDVREIIFTQEFMDRLLEFCIKKYKWKSYELIWKILLHLDNPADYLYKIIKW